MLVFHLLYFKLIHIYFLYNMAGPKASLEAFRLVDGERKQKKLRSLYFPPFKDTKAKGTTYPIQAEQSRGKHWRSLHH